ncbi:pantoate--beta-alanine ligase [Saccharobesus litoralis]|uniref:Pantothenate synthetase n=1 Tax=Saccharobesus litoralis TaxID=2172099 RepID=A0A2S0VS58_9ALTE|nr:pantoate--beta-alanine ligase [Saccharobesus litoralis]AWB67039.1 pantoate--beta-alanine ligase [Saccharobesus litoralis]
MQTVSDIKQLRNQVANWRQQGLKIAFVPTMGNLHNGHLSLVDNAFMRADIVIVSIFVNPMQFGQNEDLDAYPRTMEADSQALAERGVNLLYAPTVKDIYPRPLAEQTYVEVPELGNIICGKSRNSHFRGVTTIVNKLFNIVQPDVACFGEKDFQQLFLIKRMVEDLSMPIEVVGVPTVREESGLAMSSRNGYLSDEEKQQATALYKSLKYARDYIKQGHRDFRHIKQAMQTNIEQSQMRLDYVEFRDANTLLEANHNTTSFVVLVAAYLSSARLIDNIYFDI